MTTSNELERQARLDLAELDEQVAAGEIDDETAAKLRAGYLAEIAEARAAADRPPTRSRGRLLAGGAILVVGLAVAIGIVGSTAEPRTDEARQGVAGGEFDPASYSNETLEAVIAASADDPSVADQLPRMRFALAERYFEENRFQEAFVHYQAILDGDPPADLFASTMTRVAWITWVGNGETELALRVIDRAIETAPASTEALYVKGQIVWCGAGNPAAAVPLFEQVLSSSSLPDEVRAQVETDLELASSGEACR